MGKKADRAVAATEVVTDQTLRLLKSVNSFVGIPGVSAGAEAALGILALAQTVKSNREDFIAVGNKACTIMVTVIRKVNQAEQPGFKANMSALEEECNQIRRAMEKVQKIVYEHVEGRKRFVLLQRILYSQSDKEVIKDCKDKLQEALDLFGVQSHIEVRQGVESANRKLDELVERGEGGAAAPKIIQHAGRDAYSHTEDKSVRVNGTGNNVNVSHGAAPPPAAFYQNTQY